MTALLKRSALTFGLLPALLLLGGCNWVVMNPSGYVASQQAKLILISTGLMLLIIVPVIVATLFFGWRYRAGNTAAKYDADWHHSTRLEVLIWTAPLMIIVALGAVTWLFTHLLDPYRPLDRIDAARPVTSETRTLTVQVVALDWKWMFIYPELGIATVNEFAAPVDMPINFRLTSSAIMNSFFIPALAGQIYAMPGMQTKLHAVINEPGSYKGFSGNYSGPGFSNMFFEFKGLSNADFDAWVARVRQEGSTLDRPAYQKIEQPSEKEPVHYYSSVEKGLFQAILNMCVETGSMCMNEMMMIDRSGGAGIDSQANRERLVYDGLRSHGEAGYGPSGYAGALREAPGATAPASVREPRSEEPAEGAGQVNTPVGEQDGAAGRPAPGAAPEGANQGTTQPGNASPAPPQLNQ